MWVELICGLVIFRLLKRFFSDDSGDLAGDTSKSLRDAAEATALFAVADRLQSLYGGKAYVGLHIPDPDSASRRNIDIVLVTNRELVVISVVNLSGTVSIDRNDSSWICSPSLSASGHQPGDQRFPDPLAEIKQQVSILESYLEQRGLSLFEGYLSYKVICPNPDFRIMGSNLLPPEIVTYDQWTQQKSDTKSLLSGWIKGAFGGGKKDLQAFQEKLHLILGTAPMWDRLELKGNKLIFGEFVEFKGKQDDIQALRNIRRSKVGRLIIQKASMFNLGFILLFCSLLFFLLLCCFIYPHFGVVHSITNN
ncbi:OLC1v1021032C1 [Oldenlandia corymbosa var. corymbosa]|uniref:OLC1v1021032C1 n=1 Tax=Oldenlandia corymbosa var. corymbosa TaxID=529605 RepID=A0AAV1BUR7_OLDCO|nr:OLC1v1021032C1 [Oldenlandia corymbosa var. corymbosa]